VYYSDFKAEYYNGLTTTVMWIEMVSHLFSKAFPRAYLKFDLFNFILAIGNFPFYFSLLIMIYNDYFLFFHFISLSILFAVVR
jgi:hypothetical protein